MELPPQLLLLLLLLLLLFPAAAAAAAAAAFALFRLTGWTPRSRPRLSRVSGSTTWSTN
jgi:hypothetical protein